MSGSEPFSAEDKLRITIELIQRLNGGLERAQSWQETHRLVDLLTEGYPFFGFSVPASIEIFRARIVDDGYRFSNVSDLSARAHSDIKAFGRCNRPTKSVFYGGLNLETVLSEISAASGDVVQVLKARMKDEVTIKSTIVGEIDHARRYGTHSSATSPQFFEWVKSFWSSTDEVNRLRINLVDAFIADRFRQEAKHPFQYRVTSAFSEIIFNQSFDAFFYPSVGHLGGWNVAMKKEISDSSLVPISTTVHRILDTPGYGVFGHVIEHESASIESSGEIKYRG